MADARLTCLVLQYAQPLLPFCDLVDIVAHDLDSVVNLGLEYSGFNVALALRGTLCGFRSRAIAGDIWVVCFRPRSCQREHHSALGVGGTYIVRVVV
jgi:hypothetical protein